MAALDQLRQKVQDHALLLVQRAADQTVLATQAAAPRRDGTLAEGITHDQPVLSDTFVTCTITSAAPYSRWQDEGTGIFGPSGMRIFPKTAKALRFEIGGEVLYRKSVAGSPATRFFSEPMAARWAQALAESLGT